jgi:hypothetical protein
MVIILRKIKKIFFSFFCTDFKKKIFLLFSVDLYYKAIVWFLFWGKLKKFFFLLFCVDLYSKAIVWVLIWGKLKKKLFFFSVCTFTIRL